MTYNNVRALGIARGGVIHAMHYTGSKHGLCGWKKFNYNKVISLTPAEWGDGYRYDPPTDIFPTCIACLKASFE